MLKLLVILIIILIIIDIINAYSIQECNNTSIEVATNDDYLLKEEFKCYNDGICIQINYNSTWFEQICNCRPGYTGKQCTQLIQACNSNPCGSNGYCNSDSSSGGYFCRCKPGYRGAQCKENINDCLHSKCYNDGICVDGINSYECKCKWPYNGRYCQTKQTCNNTTINICKNNGVCIQNNDDDDDIKCVCSNEFTGVDCSTPLINNVCISQQPCLNNGICKNTNNNNNNTYECECNSNYYGKNCEFETTPTPTTTTQNNGSFVLIVNINKNEFNRRKFEIIKEFEKKYGILMLIKQDEQTKTEMIYEFKKSWCKIYFIIIFACLTSNNNETTTICLQNNINDLSDSVEILNEIKKTQLPNYVSNISYEAAGIKQQQPSNINSQTTTSNTITISTTVFAFLGILLLIGISLSLTVLIKQQNLKRIKAPIWYPPSVATSATTNEEQIYEKVKSVPKWSINKAFDDFTHLFTSPSSSSSSSSSSSDTSTNDLISNPPVKIRKLDLNTTTNLDYYPSPPESLPETTQTNILNPINFKGGFHAITPLMVYIMGRSKMSTKTQYNSNDLSIITTFCTNGADLNAKNLDGETALHLASRCGLIEIVKSLLLNGADPSLFDNYGRNVLHTGVSSNEYEIVKLILNHCVVSFQTNEDNNDNNNNDENKYDLIDAKTNDDLGDTPLIIASRLNLNKIVKLLIDFNASVNATDNDGRSALHWCSKCNNVTGACILIQSGANVNMQDNDEKTPLSSALSELSSKLMADLLIKFDAFVSQDDELKYNKMKYILDNNSLIFKTNSNDLIINNVDAIKHDLINKIKNEPNIFNTNNNTTSSNKSKTTNINNNNNTLQRNNSMKTITSTSTKRKLSDTLNNQSENKKHTSNKTLNKQQQQQQDSTIYTPLTPSPPNNNNTQISIF